MNITPDSVARAKAALDQDDPESARSPEYVSWIVRRPPDDAHVSEIEAWKDEGRAHGWVSPLATSGLFARKGLGYVGWFETGSVTLAFDHLRRHTSGDLTGELVVYSDDVNVSDGGHLLQGTMNVSALNTRATIARIVAERAPALKVDWRGYLERFARFILDAERAGQPIVMVGNRARRPAIPFLLDPLLVKGKPTILFGPEGTGKSTIAAGAAAAVVSGESVIPGWVTLDKCPVLVLDWEDDEDEWNDRLLRIAEGCRPRLTRPAEIIYRYGRGPLADDVEEVARIVAEHDVGLVIVDSVSKAAPAGREGGDPSDSAGRLFAALRYIGGASLLLDHVPKSSDKKGAERPYGSVMKPAWARITFELAAADEEDDPDIRHLVLTNRKRNSGPRTRLMGLRLEYAEDAVSFHREEPYLGEASLSVVDRILRALAGGAMTVAALAEELGEKPDTIGRDLRRLALKGRVVKVDSNLPGGVTTWGLAAPKEIAV